MAPGSRNYCFTYNNYTEEQDEAVRESAKRPEVHYLMYGYEVGESGTPHLQGFVMFTNQKSFSATKKWLKKHFLGDPNFREMDGTPHHSYVYCGKGDQDKDEWEEFKAQGENYGTNAETWEYPESKRPQNKQQQGAAGGAAEQDRWKDAYALACAGRKDEIDCELLVRYYSTFKRMEEDHAVIPADMDDLDFHWYVGKTGTGKSYDARKENPDIYLKNRNKWWDGYHGQACVLIEEMDPNSAKFLGSFMKTWCDHYAFNAEVKGGTKMLRPKKMIITSNYSIEQCFTDPAVSEPLNRRFTKTYFEGKLKLPEKTGVTKTIYDKEVMAPPVNHGDAHMATFGGGFSGAASDNGGSESESSRYNPF